VVVARGETPSFVEKLFQLSRRNGQPFSVVVLAPTVVGRDALEVLCDERRRSRPFSSGADALGLRETDQLLRFGGTGRYVLFCPNTPSQGAKELTQRLRQMLANVGDVAFGAATFPDEAYGLDDLIDVAVVRTAEAARIVTDGVLEVMPHRSARISGHTPLRKRLFDLAIVLATAPLWAPLLGVIALIIKLAEPAAPVFFKQMRTGRGGRRFPMYKFRTMVPDAEARKQDLLHLNKLQWPDFKIDDDPRITRVGRLLRATSLDEAPQILNVLTGEMSIVGPRPTSFPVETYEPWQTARLDITPGITGLWQIEGRGKTEFDERLRLDVEYIEKQSFLLDLWILLRTISAVFHRGGR
jgi:lipopolysaccharide/colanic/teichoic acid biosynthesis glycosyltransferase